MRNNKRAIEREEKESLFDSCTGRPVLCFCLERAQRTHIQDFGFVYECAHYKSSKADICCFHVHEDTWLNFVEKIDNQPKFNLKLVRQLNPAGCPYFTKTCSILFNLPLLEPVATPGPRRDGFSSEIDTRLPHRTRYEQPHVRIHAPVPIVQNNNKLKETEPDLKALFSFAYRAMVAFRQEVEALSALKADHQALKEEMEEKDGYLVGLVAELSMKEKLLTRQVKTNRDLATKLKASQKAARALDDELKALRLSTEDSLNYQAGKCVVCWSEDIEYCPTPCFHFAYCGECLDKMDQCAVCRQKIVSVQKIFKA